MVENKKGVSLMVGYVLLIVIAVALAASVYPFLKASLPVDKTECSADIYLSIDEASCSVSRKIISLKVTNKGLFNVSGAFIRFSEINKKTRAQINKGSELYLTGRMNPRPLGPGESSPILSYPFSLALNIDKEYVVEVQPAISRQRDIIPCSNKIFTQTIKCVE